MKAVLTLQIPRGDRFIPVAMTANLDVLHLFKRTVIRDQERQLWLAAEEIEAAAQRAELRRLKQTLELLIPGDDETEDSYPQEAPVG